MDSLVERLRLIAAWRKPGGPTPKQKMPNTYKAVTEAADRIEALEKALEQAEETLDQILDDMRDGGQCVCLAVKEEAIETLAKVRKALGGDAD